MNTGNSASQVLVPLPRHHESCLLDHPLELFLRWKLLNTLHQILITVSITSHDLSNKRNCPETPPLVDHIEQGAVDMTELQTRKHTTWLKHPESFTYGRLLISEIPDAKCHRIQINTVTLDEEVAWDEDSDSEADPSASAEKQPAAVAVAVHPSEITPTPAQPAPAPGTTMPTSHTRTDSDAMTLRPSRRSHDEKSVADSEASYDLVSGAASHADSSPNPRGKPGRGESDDEDDDWE